MTDIKQGDRYRLLSGPDTVLVVTHPEPDSDGEIGLASLDDTNRVWFRLPEELEQVTTEPKPGDWVRFQSVAGGGRRCVLNIHAVSIGGNPCLVAPLVVDCQIIG